MIVWHSTLASQRLLICKAYATIVFQVMMCLIQCSLARGKSIFMLNTAWSGNLGRKESRFTRTNTYKYLKRAITVRLFIEAIHQWECNL